MTIPITSVVQNSNQSWTFTWANSGQAYSRVVLWGIQLLKTTNFTYTWSGFEYTTYPPPLEIAYEDQQVLSEQFLPYLVMQWYGEQTAATYVVQENLAGTWTTIQTLLETGQWIYTFITPILTDETTYSYRVIALDDVGDESVPRGYNIYVVCPPLPTDGKVMVSYNQGTTSIVVSAV